MLRTSRPSESTLQPLATQKRLPLEATNESRAMFPCGVVGIRRPWIAALPLTGANDEVERRAGAQTPNETDLSQSSTPSLAHRIRAPRSLEPIVRSHQDIETWNI